MALSTFQYTMPIPSGRVSSPASRIISSNLSPSPPSAPNSLDEKERIEAAAGGMIINWNGWRVLSTSRSRSLGDEYLKPYVCSEPEVNVVKLTGLDEFLIIGTDGLFDVVANEMACDYVKRCLTGKIRRKVTGESRASEAATLLAELAMAKRSEDNISVIVVQMK